MRILLFALALSFVQILSGQGEFIGLAGSYLVSNIQADEKFGTTGSLNGFQAGFQYGRQVKGDFMIGGGVEFGVRGYKDEIQFTDELGQPVLNEDLRHEYHYVMAPIKFGFSIGEKFSGGFLNMGVVPAFLRKAEIVSSGNLRFPGLNPDLVGSSKQYDISGLFEFGANVELVDRVNLMLSFTYQRSFTNFFDNELYRTVEARHSAIVIGGGLRYIISPKVKAES